MRYGTSLAICLLAMGAAGGGGAELVTIERRGTDADQGTFEAPPPRFDPMPPPGPRQDRWRRRQQAEAAGAPPPPHPKAKASPERKARRKAQRKARRGNR